MKKIYGFAMAIAIAALFQACNGSKASSNGDSSATKSDSTTMNSDSSKTGSTGSTGATSDTAFTNKAAVSGMAEVALGKMALSKTSDPQLKQFAQMMVTDHGKANAELQGIAQKKSITLPASLDAEHQQKSDSLSKLSGKDFDRGYISVMVEGHQKTLALMQSEASGGQDSDLKAFASKTAPIVKTHLDLIQKIQAKSK